KKLAAQEEANRKEAAAKALAAKSAVGIIFKVQLLASSRDMPLRSEDFRGLNKLSKEPYNNLFRYMYGNVNTHFDAKLLKSNADAKGYTTSYIVAYKEGKRIPLAEALKYVSE
ncbi:MAG: N-acetylmuramoyl-L-alanine amidase, partial [Bacteroidota bacterium]